MKRTRFSLGAASAAASLLNGTALFGGVPASFVWNGGTGNWSVGANWVGGVAPFSGAIWEIDDGDPIASVCEINTPATIGGATIDADDRIRIVNGQILIGTGTINNAGVLRVDSTGGHTYFRPGAAPLSLTGGGTVEFSDTATNWLYKHAGGGTFINVDNTIEGAGNLGWSGSPTAITNQTDGVIIAKGVNRLVCDAGGAGFTNAGLMKAESGGILRLQNNFDNTGGTIAAMNGSTVELHGCTISGGLLDAAGTGLILTSANTVLLDGSVTEVGNAGVLRISNAQVLTAQGTLNNTGTIRVASTGNDTYLRATNVPLVLTGGGLVELSDSAANWIYRSAAGGTLVNADNTIRGAGNLGWSGSPTPITNRADGTIIANGTNRLVCDSGSATFTNAGRMQAESGGVLRLQNGFENEGGTIAAMDGSTVELHACTIRGGLLDAPGTGQFVTSISNSLLDGAANPVENTGLLKITNTHVLRAQGTLNNSGTIRLDSTGGNTYLRATTQPLMLTGGGTVVLSDFTANWMFKDAAGGAFINVDNTISGAGNVGWNGSPTPFTNQVGGTLIANGTNPLILDAGGAETWNNQGTLQATGAGGLDIRGLFTNSGNVNVAAGSKLVRSSQDYVQTAGMTRIDGLFQSQAAAVDLDLQGGVLQGVGTIASDVFNNGGSVQPGNSIGTLTVNGVYTQVAAAALRIELGGVLPTPANDRLVVSGAASLSGTLTGVAVSGYMPAVGDRFTILQHNSRTGTFNAFSAAGFADATLTVRAAYSATATDLIVVRPGDMNCNGALSVSDIAPFVMALTAPAQYEVDFASCEIFNADINGDGAISVGDIGSFVELLTQ